MIADVSNADVSQETFLKDHPTWLGEEPDQYCAVCVLCFQARKGGWVSTNGR
jgi:hypothetical protein